MNAKVEELRGVPYSLNSWPLQTSGGSGSGEKIKADSGLFDAVTEFELSQNVSDFLRQPRMSASFVFTKKLLFQCATKRYPPAYSEEFTAKMSFQGGNICVIITFHVETE